MQDDFDDGMDPPEDDVIEEVTVTELEYTMPDELDVEPVSVETVGRTSGGARVRTDTRPRKPAAARPPARPAAKAAAKKAAPKKAARKKARKAARKAAPSKKKTGRKKPAKKSARKAPPRKRKAGRKKK